MNIDHYEINVSAPAFETKEHRHLFRVVFPPSTTLEEVRNVARNLLRLHGYWSPSIRGYAAQLIYELPFSSDDDPNQTPITGTTSPRSPR